VLTRARDTRRRAAVHSPSERAALLTDDAAAKFLARGPGRSKSVTAHSVVNALLQRRAAGGASGPAAAPLMTTPVKAEAPKARPPKVEFCELSDSEA
jgi:hypothetical protein